MNKFLNSKSLYGTYILMGFVFSIVTVVYGVHFSNILEKENALFERGILNDINEEKIGDTEGNEKINDNNIKSSVQFISSILTIFSVAIAFFSFAIIYIHRHMDEQERQKKDEEQKNNYNELITKLDLLMELIKTHSGANGNTNLIEKEELKQKLYIPDNLNQLSVDLNEAIKHSKINQNN